MGKLELTTINQKVLIAAKPMEAYEAYVNPKIQSEYTGSKTTCDPREGGKFTAWDGYIFGKHVKLEPGKLLVQEWATTEWPNGCPPSLVTLTFENAGGKTLLRMKHSKVPKEQADSYAKGWKDYYWEPMKKYFEKRKRSR